MYDPVEGHLAIQRNLKVFSFPIILALFGYRITGEDDRGRDRSVTKL